MIKKRIHSDFSVHKFVYFRDRIRRCDSLFPCFLAPCISLSIKQDAKLFLFSEERGKNYGIKLSVSNLRNTIKI